MGVSRERCRVLQLLGSASYSGGEMDQTLKRVNGELRMIGSRLDRIDRKLPDFDLKIKDLKEEEDKVARYWTDLKADHETTFLRTQRRLENSHERRRRSCGEGNHFGIIIIQEMLTVLTIWRSEWRCLFGCNKSTKAPVKPPRKTQR